MECHRKLTTLCALFVLVCLAFPRDAHAYLDPGTGSFILQLVIGGLLGGLFALKIFWKNLKVYLAGLFRREEVTEKEEEPSGKDHEQQ